MDSEARHVNDWLSVLIVARLWVISSRLGLVTSALSLAHLTHKFLDRIALNSAFSFLLLTLSEHRFLEKSHVDRAGLILPETLQTVQCIVHRGLVPFRAEATHGVEILLIIFSSLSDFEASHPLFGPFLFDFVA